MAPRETISPVELNQSGLELLRLAIQFNVPVDVDVATPRSSKNIPDVTVISMDGGILRGKKRGKPIEISLSSVFCILLAPPEPPGRLPDMKPIFKAMLASRLGEIRTSALYQLDSYFPTEFGLPFVLAKVGDPDPKVRTAAAKVVLRCFRIVKRQVNKKPFSLLEPTPDSSVREALTTLATTDSDPGVRAAAQEAIAALAKHDQIELDYQAAKVQKSSGGKGTV